MSYDINDSLTYLRANHLTAEQEVALRRIVNEDVFVHLTVKNSLEIPAVPDEMRQKAYRAKQELAGASKALKALSFDARANVEKFLIRPGSLYSVQAAIDAAIDEYEKPPSDKDFLAGGLAWLAHYFKIKISSTEGSQFVDLAQIMLAISERSWSAPEMARRAKQMHDETDMTGIPQYPESLMHDLVPGSPAWHEAFGRNLTGKF